MKKNTIGIGLLVLAGLILFQDYLPSMDISLWTLSRFAGVGVLFVIFLYKRRLIESVIFGLWFFVLLNDQFEFVSISRTSLLLVGVLLCLGISLLTKSNSKSFYFKSFGSSQETGDVFSSGKPTVFSTSTRYIQDDDFVEDSIEVVFGTAHIYLDNAIMERDQGRFTVEATFSTVNLYVPSDWQVKVQMDSIFSHARNLSQSDGSKILLVVGDLTFTTLTIYSV